MEPTEAARSLAEHLRRLRESSWPGRSVTQKHVAKALGVSVPSVSSWESRGSPKVPPIERLSAYALFFATERSLDGRTPRLLPEAQLTPEELVRRRDIEQDLHRLHALCQDAGGGVAASAHADPFGADVS